MKWGHAREIARVPAMDRDGSAAYLWGDGSSFAILWAPEARFLARAVKERENPLRTEAYKKTLDRWVRAGEPIIACYDAQVQPLAVGELASLIQRRHVSWASFKVWKYYGIGGNNGDDTSCKFELQERLPATSAHTTKIYRALHAHLTPSQWQQMLPMFPSDAVSILRRDARRNRWARPVLLLVIVALLIWAAWELASFVGGVLG